MIPEPDGLDRLDPAGHGGATGDTAGVGGVDAADAAATLDGGAAGQRPGRPGRPGGGPVEGVEAVGRRPGRPGGGPVEGVEAVGRRPGRPRDARVDEAILDAAGEVMARSGPGGFTVDAVADLAGVGKATIYRRWPSRAELMLATTHRAVIEIDDPDTGSVRSDLVFALSALAVKLQVTNVGRLLPALMAEAAVNPEMSRVFAAFTHERRDMPRAFLVRAVERGELPPDTDLDLAMDLLGGAIFYRTLVARTHVEPESVEQMVDAVLLAVGAGGIRTRDREAVSEPEGGAPGAS